MWDLVSWPGIKPRPLHWERGVLSTAPLGKSLQLFFDSKCSQLHDFFQGLVVIKENNKPKNLSSKDKYFLLSRLPNKGCHRQRSFSNDNIVGTVTLPPKVILFKRKHSLGYRILGQFVRKSAFVHLVTVGDNRSKTEIIQSICFRVAPRQTRQPSNTPTVISALVGYTHYTQI